VVHASDVKDVLVLVHSQSFREEVGVRNGESYSCPVYRRIAATYLRDECLELRVRMQGLKLRRFTWIKSFIQRNALFQQ